MWFCMPDGLREIVLSFKFRQNRLNGFRDLGGRNLPFPILKAMAYITACTTVQAVIVIVKEAENASKEHYDHFSKARNILLLYYRSGYAVLDNTPLI